MKNAVVGFAAICALLATPALAADLGAPPPTSYYKAPPLPPMCVWCGFYIGGNAGYSWGAARSTFDFPGYPAFLSDSTHPNGVIGGGQLGYNWQTGNVLFGFESDAQGSGQRKSRTVSALTPLGAFSLTQTDKETWFGTTRARLGFTAGGPLLLYGTGGVAYGDVSSAFGLTTPIGAAAVSNSSTRAGWTAGGGFEYMLLPRLSFKAEYLHMDLGNKDFALPFAFTQHIRFQANIARAGINYHFGGPF
jgi:outer membrane immunogenic protein